MKRMSVGGVIVLGARESRVHGEGRQGIDAPKVEINRHMPDIEQPYPGEI